MSMSDGNPNKTCLGSCPPDPGQTCSCFQNQKATYWNRIKTIEINEFHNLDHRDPSLIKSCKYRLSVLNWRQHFWQDFFLRFCK